MLKCKNRKAEEGLRKFALSQKMGTKIIGNISWKLEKKF